MMESDTNLDNLGDLNWRLVGMVLKFRYSVLRIATSHKL